MNGSINISVVCFIAFFAVFSPICNSAPHSGALPKVRIAVSTTPLSAPIYIAKVKGFFAVAGIDVSISEVAGGDQCFKKLSEKQVDLATVSNSVIMFNSFKQTNFEIVTGFAESDNDIKIISLKQSGINNPQDLQGRTVGVIKGSASEYFLHRWLTKTGQKVSWVKTKSYRVNALPEALQAGEVDAISVWEPFAYISGQLSNDTVIMETKGLFNLSFNLVGLKDNPALTYSAERGHNEQIRDKLLEALTKAVHFIAVNPEESQLILRRHLKLSQGFIDWVWQDYTFKLSIDHTLLESLESQALWAIDNDVVLQENMPDFGQLIIQDR